ncbi:conserved hypothetical protein [Pseudarthrobacter chlorophenolicus A6]|uniref:Uncharacterized protein n=1 Tax=Pseudarthrobacter chlorophenolicus (strain ATCC 700700 / DSM 12829 / CIP 107037 / JCM 12360 / KCTC 9906 / NCIMB 13794 / A6) TaxID=452863 RepID=B8H6K1_PSECP|nr:hypothetical protein [Pseudarthrobacter chlorophenolicus]ACL41527.1 conserved hypothetical protein [Pseudarthrobacter chlorophenolicus A6]SDQ62621.1 hypothetical protein SAMN04489738_1906 [Pseudarthrobacter chlorophenolicus]
MVATSLVPAPTTAAPAAERTTAAGRVRAKRPVLHARLVAVVTAVSCAAHLWLAAAGHHGLWLGILMVALAAVCVPCTVHIWRHSAGPARGSGALHQVTASALVMVAVHAALLLSGMGNGGAGHAHGGAPASSAAAVSSPGTEAAAQLLLVIGLELVTALLAATLVARLRTAQLRTARRAG